MEEGIVYGGDRLQVEGQVGRAGAAGRVARDQGEREAEAGGFLEALVGLLHGTNFACQAGVPGVSLPTSFLSQRAQPTSAAFERSRAAGTTRPLM